MTGLSDTTSELFQKAVAASTAKNWTESADLWRKVCAADGANAAAHLNLGIALAELRVFHESEEHLAIACDLAPAVKSLRWLYQVQFRARRFKEMEHTIYRLIAFTPSRGDLYIMLAKIIGSRGALTEAVEVLKRGTLAAPDDFDLAIAHLNAAFRDDDDGAIAALEQLYQRVSSSPAKAKIALRMLANINNRKARRAKGLPEQTTVSWDDTCRWSDPEGLRRLADHLRREISQPGATLASQAELGFCAIAEMNWDAGEALLRNARAIPSGDSVDVVTFDLATYAELERFSDADLMMGLPEVVTIKPPPADMPFSVFLGSDPIYFERFTLPLLQSFRRYSADVHLHAHIIDGDTATWERLTALAVNVAGPCVSVSAEKATVNGSKLYYAAIRYVRSFQYLKAVSRPVWIMDVDAVVNHDPSDILGNIAAFDLALWGCPGWLEPWNKVQASLVGIAPTPTGFAFSRLVAAYIFYWYRRGGLRWCTDQSALFGVYSYLHRQRKTPRTMFLDPSAISVTGDPAGAIQFNRGIQKFVI